MKRSSEGNPNSKLTRANVEQIIALYTNGASSRELEEIFGVGQTCIGDIIRGKSWKDVPRPGNLSRGTRKQQLAKLPILTSTQQEILTGSLLGDGCISRCGKNGNFYFSETRASKYVEYAQWLFDSLSPYSYYFKEKQGPGLRFINGRIQRDYAFGTLKSCWWRTYPHPVFTALRKEWYKDGKKALPSTLDITPLAMAIWFCDDGSTNAKQREVRISTNSFTTEECERLCQYIEKYGIKAYVLLHQYPAGKQPKIHITGDSNFRTMIELVSPHIVWDCMKYKLDMSSYKKPKYWSKVTEAEVKEIRELIQQGLSQKKIGQKYGLTQTSISHIARGKTWVQKEFR